MIPQRALPPSSQGFSNHGTRVLIVDDHCLVRESLATRLNSEADIEVVGTAGDAAEAVSLALVLNPNVILMDIRMPGLSCFDAVRTLDQQRPDARVLFLSAHCLDGYIEEALQLNAWGYVSKQANVDCLLRAIRAVHQGNRFYSPEVEERFGRPPRQGADKRPVTRVSLLTQRERDVLRYVSGGLSAKQIAALLHISVRTVDRHRANIMDKLDIHDRVELAGFAYREGIAQP